MIQGIGNSPKASAPVGPSPSVPAAHLGPEVTVVHSPIDPGPAIRVEISMQARMRASLG